MDVFKQRGATAEDNAWGQAVGDFEAAVESGDAVLGKHHLDKVEHLALMAALEHWELSGSADLPGAAFKLSRVYLGRVELCFVGGASRALPGGFDALTGDLAVGADEAPDVPTLADVLEDVVPKARDNWLASREMKLRPDEQCALDYNTAQVLLASFRFETAVVRQDHHLAGTGAGMMILRDAYADAEYAYEAAEGAFAAAAKVGRGDLADFDSLVAECADALLGIDPPPPSARISHDTLRSRIEKISGQDEGSSMLTLSLGDLGRERLSDEDWLRSAGFLAASAVSFTRLSQLEVDLLQDAWRRRSRLTGTEADIVVSEGLAAAPPGEPFTKDNRSYFVAIAIKFLGAQMKQIVMNGDSGDMARGLVPLLTTVESWLPIEWSGQALTASETVYAYTLDALEIVLNATGNGAMANGQQVNNLKSLARHLTGQLDQIDEEDTYGRDLRRDLRPVQATIDAL